MIKALVMGGLYVLFISGIMAKWWSKHKSESADHKPKGMPSSTAYNEIDDPIQALSDSHWQVRLSAVQRLLENPTDDAVPALVKSFDDDDPDVRQTASEVLVKIGEDALPTVIQVLEDGTLDARIAAMQTLAHLHSPKTLEALSHAILHDESVWVRLPALKALADYPAVLTTHTMIQALKDENQELYNMAVTMLREIGTPDALQAIKDHPYTPAEKSR